MAITKLAHRAFADLAWVPGKDFLDLCLPARQVFVVERQRRSTMDGRVRTAARTIAALTAGWILVDALTFSSEVWLPLAGERLLTSLALLLISIVPLHERRGFLVEARAFGILLVVLAFFLSAGYTLAATQANMESLAAVSAYVNLPFLAAAGIGLLPIVAAEGLVAAGLVVGATVLAATALPGAGAAGLYNAGSLWLLTAICGVATLGGMLQLRSLIMVTQQSSRDGLTGLLQRRFGEELLAAQFAAARRGEQPFSVMFLDLDRFKSINDGYGHEAGDLALAAAAGAIRNGIRDQDTAVRWGGEEFLVILPDTDADGARMVAERLGRHGLGPRPDGPPLTACVGLAERLADNAATGAELVAFGDERTYAAKHAGRNRIMDVAGNAHTFTAAATPDQAAPA